MPSYLTAMQIITRNGLEPAFKMLPELMDSPRARVEMLAIALQESRLMHRYQKLNNTNAKGPARSYWQFEQGGGVAGVLRHELSKPFMKRVCEARGVPATPSSVWRTMENDDVLAAAAARLLLWTDPQRLPELGDVNGAWALYTRTWRPGKPHRDTWNELYGQALSFVTKGTV